MCSSDLRVASWARGAWLAGGRAWLAGGQRGPRVASGARGAWPPLAAIAGPLRPLPRHALQVPFQTRDRLVQVLAPEADPEVVAGMAEP